MTSIDLFNLIPIVAQNNFRLNLPVVRSMYGSLMRTPIDVDSDFLDVANFGCTVKSNRPEN